ncbi:MAG: hypothetical protein K0S85_4688 [Pseudomonas orientalis]|nr:hypothetical protein [Pseudomonas orientalis]
MRRCPGPSYSGLPRSWLIASKSRNRRDLGRNDSAIYRTTGESASRSSALALHQLIHQQNPQLTQLVNRQRHVALFAGQFIRQVEQQGGNRGEGFIAVGDERFAAGILSDAEQRGRWWCRRLGASVEVVIDRTMRRLIEFQVGIVWRVWRDFEPVCCTCFKANTFSLLNERVAAVRRLVDRGNTQSRRARGRPAHSHHQAQTRTSDR